MGAEVARELGLQLGDRFHPYHGLEYNPDRKHNDIYLVVGILEPTGTPTDQVIWIPLRGVQTMEGHDPEEANSISGVLLNLKGSSGLALDVKYNKQGDRATLAWPVPAILSSFFNRFAWLERSVAALALLMALVGGLIILATLRTTMHERRREFAVLRCMGASRTVVTGSILWQSILLSAFGALGSWIIYFLLIHGCIIAYSFTNWCGHEPSHIGWYGFAYRSRYSSAWPCKCLVSCPQTLSFELARISKSSRIVGKLGNE